MNSESVSLVCVSFYAQWDILFTAFLTEYIMIDLQKGAWKSEDNATYKCQIYVPQKKFFCCFLIAYILQY